MEDEVAGRMEWEVLRARRIAQDQEKAAVEGDAAEEEEGEAEEVEVKVEGRLRGGRGDGGWTVEDEEVGVEEEEADRLYAELSSSQSIPTPPTSTSS